MPLFCTKTCRSSLALLRAILAFCGLLAFLPAARAGGGPENILLVVNSADSDSLTIANHYIQLRQIPPSNVMYLNWRGSPAKTDINTFREKILMPLLGEMDTRKISAQIDYVVYSSGFPVGHRFFERRAASVAQRPTVAKQPRSLAERFDVFDGAGRFERFSQLH